MSTLTKLRGPAALPAGVFDLAGVGYVEEEFLIGGETVSYTLAGERTTDGKWSVAHASRAPYLTRFTVRRPTESARFSGTVAVEWNNVSGGVDLSPDWTCLHRHLIRRGDIHVGVTAQKVGVDGGGIVEGLHLKKISPERYGSLNHPGDAWSFDIFSQVGRALTGGATSPLGAMAPSRMIAIGESQSAMHLITYINAIDPAAKLFDGFFVHGRGAAGASLEGAIRVSGGGDLPSLIKQAQPERIREDCRVPVIVLQSETDVVSLGGGRPEQPDGTRLRLWEIAGTAHADTYLLCAAPLDDGSLSAERFAELLRPTTQLPIGTTDSPINSGPHQHYVGQAAFEALDQWIRGSEAPAHAARLELTPDGSACALDECGNARGGIRTPWVDAPAAVLSGMGQGGGVFGFLFGTTKPLAADTLAKLYPRGRTDYVARFTASLDDAMAKGFILAEDRDEIIAVASAAFPA